MSETSAKSYDMSSAIESVIEHIEQARVINRGRLNGIDTALDNAETVLRELLQEGK